jgi:hypothetical protein
LLRATDWPFAAAIFPAAATSAGLLLSITGLIAPFSGASRRLPSRTGGGLIQKEVTTFCWILSFFALVVLVGFEWGLPAAALLYLRFEGKASIIWTVFYSGACWFFLYAAQAWLHLPLYEGFVFLGSF